MFKELITGLTMFLEYFKFSSKTLYQMISWNKRKSHIFYYIRNMRKSAIGIMIYP